jgi:hypothetical protein
VRYMLLICNPALEKEQTPEEWQAAMAPYAPYMEFLRASGKFVDGDPLHGVSTATTVRVRDGKRMITDGPFAETKEWLAGYVIVDCDTLDEAIELAAPCPATADGCVEIRPIIDVN